VNTQTAAATGLAYTSTATTAAGLDVTTTNTWTSAGSVGAGGGVYVYAGLGANSFALGGTNYYNNAAMSNAWTAVTYVSNGLGTTIPGTIRSLAYDGTNYVTVTAGSTNLFTTTTPVVASAETNPWTQIAAAFTPVVVNGTTYTPSGFTTPTSGQILFWTGKVWAAITQGGQVPQAVSTSAVGTTWTSPTVVLPSGSTSQVGYGVTQAALF